MDQSWEKKILIWYPPDDPNSKKNRYFCVECGKFSGYHSIKKTKRKAIKHAQKQDCMFDSL